MCFGKPKVRLFKDLKKMLKSLSTSSGYRLLLSGIRMMLFLLNSLFILFMVCYFLELLDGIEERFLTSEHQTK